MRSLARSSLQWLRRSTRGCGHIGYAHVTVDLRGYRLGSLNDALRLREL